LLRLITVTALPPAASPSLRSQRVSRASLAAGALVALAVSALSGGSEGAPRFETRCGWFDNPTPANVWLHDRDGQWTIGIQGGPMAEGPWPTFKKRQWVHTNGGSYGYGCACLRVEVDRKAKRVLTIANAEARELSVCRADPALKEP
jgi:Protein of unknown function (DUF4087)